MTQSDICDCYEVHHQIGTTCTHECHNIKQGYGHPETDYKTGFEDGYKKGVQEVLNKYEEAFKSIVGRQSQNKIDVICKGKGERGEDSITVNVNV